MFNVNHLIRNMYGNHFVETTYVEAIERHAPMLAPHWGMIALLGLEFTEAHTLVFGSPDKVVDLPADLALSA